MGQTVEAPEFDVIVAGFGPSGAVATCFLAQAGLRVLVLDKSRTVFSIPRAIAIDHEILRLLQNLGIAEEVLKHTAPFPASEHFGAQGQLIRRINTVPPPYPMGYFPTMVFTQPPVEAILRGSASASPNVEVALGVELVDLSQEADRVTIETRDDSGLMRRISASYLIACDGASSRVRQQLGIKLLDLGFDEPWMVIDVKVSEAGINKLPITSAQYCDPRRPSTYIVGPGNHRRWEIMLLPGEDPRVMEQRDNVWRLLEPWLTPQDGELWRASSYRFHALLAERWRAGRVFLAGDAAHQQPPFIGQGMCQGIRDATNISWKLASVLTGGADKSLLDTYAQERSPHVHTLSSRIKEIGHHICERDPEKARLRDDLLLAKGNGQALTVTRQEIVPPLLHGLFADDDNPVNGTLFPQPWVLAGQGAVLMDEVTGHGWRLVFHSVIDCGQFERFSGLNTFSIGPEALQERDGVVSEWFRRYACIAAVVRPDHYVYGVASTPAEVNTLVSSIAKKLDFPLHPRQSMNHRTGVECVP